MIIAAQELGCSLFDLLEQDADLGAYWIEAALDWHREKIKAQKKRK